MKTYLQAFLPFSHSPTFGFPFINKVTRFGKSDQEQYNVMTISPGWRALQHCFNSQFCMHTDKFTTPFFVSITIQMYKARLKKMRNALTEYSKHRKMKQLSFQRTPIFSCCTSDLTPNPTSCSLHSQHKKQDAFILIWMTRKDLWLHPSFSTENKVFQSTLSHHLCILFVYFLCIHHHLCSHPVWN